MEKEQIIAIDIVVDTTIERVWDTLYTRFGEIHRFNPNLEGSHFTKGSSGEVGCERQCNLDSKTFIKERILHADPMKSFSVDVIGGNMPMVEKLLVTFTLKSINSLQTQILLKANFTTKPTFMAWLMKSPFKTRLTKLLIGLKYHLETGADVSKSSFGEVFSKYKKLAPQEAFS